MDCTVISIYKGAKHFARRSGGAGVGRGGGALGGRGGGVLGGGDEGGSSDEDVENPGDLHIINWSGGIPSPLTSYTPLQHQCSIYYSSIHALYIQRDCATRLRGINKKSA